MSSDQIDAVYPDADLDDEDDPSSSDNEEDEELEEEESEDINTRPIAAAPVTTVSSDYSIVPLALPAVTVASIPSASASDSKRHHAKKPLAQLDESRRLFQRLWTDEDEIELLQGFLEYTAHKGNSSSHHHHDTTLFYDQIKSRLQLDFNKSQLVEKLRRLKKKYRNVISKISSGKDFSFKSPHDQATFEISRKIWSNSSVGKGNVDYVLDDDDANGSNVNSIDDGVEKKTPNSRKRSRSKFVDEKRGLGDGVLPNNTTSNSNGKVEKISGGGLAGANVAGLIEETVKSCLSPMFKELLGNATGGGAYGVRGFGGLAMNAMPLNFVGLSSGSGGDIADERWRKQQILELEVYSKRLELVQDQIKAALEELRSTGR